jgi:6-pyruvoyl-tetrahydropterin synthase
METRLTAKADFSAGTKRSNGEERHPHGHTYFVEATSVSQLNSVDWALPDKLESIVGELHERNLEDMMRGGSTDLDGIARWILERLMSSVPSIVEVTVTEGGQLGRTAITARRELRAAVR